MYSPRVCLAALASIACATTPAPYSERCQDSTRPCTLSYDFEPSAVARDVFSTDPDHFLVVNEDGLVFSWNLSPKDPWNHDNVDFVRALGDSVTKLESATSAVCDGTPVLLAATNFAPGRGGPSPKRQRVVAVVGQATAPVRVLEQTSAVIAALPAKYDAASVKVEGLALTADCKTLLVGLRSVLGADNSERFVTDIYRVALDVDWNGTREAAVLGEPIPFGPQMTCSGKAEGIASLETLKDGSTLVVTSYEKETRPRTKPEEIATADLGGTLWRRSPDGTATRLACFPKHKPEAVAVSADESVARVIMEDDDYGGRPIRAWAVKIPLR